MSIMNMAAGQLEVHLGSTVSFTDATAERDQTYRIVDPLEAKPSDGRLSSASPVGGALIGHHVGDLVEVRTPKGVRQLQIAAIA
jgi:transcription elongation factor GreA